MPSVQTAMRSHVPESSAATFIIAAGICLKRLVHNVWLGVREWCGDSAYERYLLAKSARSIESRILTPAEFYVEQLDRRYSRPNRCC